MEALRKLVRGSSSYLFKLFILLLAIVSAFVITFHSPKKIEKSLQQSGAYSTFIDNVLAEAKKSATTSSGSDNIPIDDPAIKDAINKSFSPAFLQASTEKVLNGTYDWMSGKTKTPDFVVDVAPAKQTFATAVGQAAANRLNSLPLCTRAQLLQLDINNVDPFSVPCRPPGLNVAQQQAQLVNNINTSKDFLATTQINAQTLPKDSSGKTVFDNLAQVPRIYKWVNASPWILGLLVLLTGTIMVLLHDYKRRGLRSIAVSLGIMGSVLFVLGLVATWSLHRATSATGLIGKSVNNSFQQTAIKGVNSLFASFEQVIVWFGAVYLIIAIIMLIILHFTKPKTAPQDKKEPPKDSDKPVDNKSQQPEAQPTKVT